jgi:hypothetical protein
MDSFLVITKASDTASDNDYKDPIRDSGLSVNVEHRSVFWRACREVVVVSKPA